MLVFRVLPYGYQLEMKDYFQFAGALFGAIIGALVSFEILNITIKNQREEFEKQRDKDEERWKTTINQFDIQVKIQGINDKINDFNQAINSLKKLKISLNNHCDNIETILSECEESGQLNSTYTDRLIESNLDVLNSLEDMRLKSQCFRKIKKDIHYNNICNSLTSGKYFIKLTEGKMDINEYKIALRQYGRYIIKIDFSIFNLNMKITSSIGILYEEKYRLTNV